MENTKVSRRVNLIPSEMAVPATAVKAAKLINKMSIVAVILLIIGSLTVAGLFFYYNNESNNQIARINALKAKITNLSQSEQKLILAKDRLAKIDGVQKDKSVSNEVNRFKKFSDLVTNSVGTTVSEANLNSAGSEVSIFSPTSDSLSQLFIPLAGLKDYKTITIDSLGFNLKSGFTATLNMSTE